MIGLRKKIEIYNIKPYLSLLHYLQTRKPKVQTSITMIHENHQKKNNKNKKKRGKKSLSCRPVLQASKENFHPPYAQKTYFKKGSPKEMVPNLTTKCPFFLALVTSSYGLPSASKHIVAIYCRIHEQAPTDARIQTWRKAMPTFSFHLSQILHRIRRRHRHNILRCLHRHNNILHQGLNHCPCHLIDISAAAPPSTALEFDL